MSRPTLKDVAARTGLSVTQVSRALNDHDDVADSTKALAKKVAAELRYTPNLEARRLKDPDVRSNSIGIVLPSESLRFSDPFFGDMLTAMVAEAGAAGYQLALSTPPSGTVATEPYDLMIRRKQVDGFVLLRTANIEPRVDLLRRAGVPFVTLGRPDGSDDFPAVELAEDCFVPVVDHLLELGHRRVACLAEPTGFALGSARLRAFRYAAHTRGLTVDDADIVAAGFHEGAGRDAAASVLARPQPPTAIVAMNDLLAIGAVHAAVEAGLSVPTDLTVTGFDDIQAARAMRPMLTTVQLSATRVGSALIRLMLAEINGTRAEVQHPVPTSFVVRESSAPAADGESHARKSRTGP